MTKEKTPKLQNEPTAATHHAVQRRAKNQGEQTAVPGIVHDVLQTPGQSLDTTTRAALEPRFGYDFSQVRVHTDAKAAESAKSINAAAYTAGNHVVFANRRYEPMTQTGQRLLAHELTHVIQQKSGLVSGGGIRSANDVFEQKAEYVAQQMTQQVAPIIQPKQAASPYHSAMPIQRQPENGEEEGPVVKIDDTDHFQPTGSTETPAQEEEETPLQMMPDDAPFFTIQRQSVPDIPPPPTIFPHFSEWFFDVSDVMGEMWNLTCSDRLERGFFIMWNEKIKKAFPHEIVLGNDHEIELGTVPRDRKPVFPVAWFHTHPRPKPGFVSVEVGPSKKDKNTSQNTKLPGAVWDFNKPGVTDCKKSGVFFFGPERRPS